MRWSGTYPDVEAWTLGDGTLIIRRKVTKPMDGFDHYFEITTLNKEQPHSGYEGTYQGAKNRNQP